MFRTHVSRAHAVARDLGFSGPCLRCVWRRRLIYPVASCSLLALLAQMGALSRPTIQIIRAFRAAPIKGGASGDTRFVQLASGDGGFSPINGDRAIVCHRVWADLSQSQVASGVNHQFRSCSIVARPCNNVARVRRRQPIHYVPVIHLVVLHPANRNPLRVRLRGRR